MQNMSLALIVALPFFGAVLMGLAARIGRSAPSILAGIISLGALALLGRNIPAVLGGTVLTAQFNWLPAYHLNANFMLDGLGMLFALLILGMGVLIIIFAHAYLDASEPKGQFYAYLLLFQGAMLGIVLADNMLLLLVFWELTSLSSFLLIGFWRHDPLARSGARMALAITSGGGLALFAGLLILGNIAGSYDFTAILAARDQIQNSPLYDYALTFILIGAFTKSAQLPFHFWLPHAMSAPTPVSAYLHSATMVKAGIFLLARFWYVLAGTDHWYYIVTTTGLLTMLLGAIIALFKTDIKSILAYSTISHLGLITFLLGLGTTAGVHAALVHIICHASFKAALFMMAGIIEHTAHTRDIRQLGGLGRLMPISFLIAAISSLSMAGLPPFNGFLSKEMAFDAAHSAPWIIPTLLVLAAAVSVGYSIRLLTAIFLSKPASSNAYHDPSMGMWIAPMILALCAVLIGLVPMSMIGGIVNAASHSVTFGTEIVVIKLWHGFSSVAVWMSFSAFILGYLIFKYAQKLRRLYGAIMRIDGKSFFESSLRTLSDFARRAVFGAHNGDLRRYMALAFIAAILATAYVFGGGKHSGGMRTMLPVNTPALITTAALLIAIMATIRLHHQRMIALMMVGIAGLMIALGFAYFSAPDLALTQIAVEVMTVILMLLALNYLPQITPPEIGIWARGRDGIIAILAGLGSAILAYIMMMRDAALTPISAFHLAQSKSAAGGTNAVNTIIVDFRGFDTYGEIIVLAIAGLIVSAIIASIFAQNVEITGGQNAANIVNAGDPYPLILRTAAGLILPFAICISIYIYLRGHNQPGGGFVAGLILSFAFLLQNIASGQKWGAAQAKLHANTIIGVGIFIASLTGLGSLLAHRPFLTSNYTYITAPPLEAFELTTASIFDLGILLCVFGTVMRILTKISQLNSLAKRGR